MTMRSPANSTSWSRLRSVIRRQRLSPANYGQLIMLAMSVRESKPWPSHHVDPIWARGRPNEDEQTDAEANLSCSSDPARDAADRRRLQDAVAGSRDAQPARRVALRRHPARRHAVALDLRSRLGAVAPLRGEP